MLDAKELSKPCIPPSVGQSLNLASMKAGLIPNNVTKQEFCPKSCGSTTHFMLWISSPEDSSCSGLVTCSGRAIQDHG